MDQKKYQELLKDFYYEYCDIPNIIQPYFASDPVAYVKGVYEAAGNKDGAYFLSAYSVPAEYGPKIIQKYKGKILCISKDIQTGLTLLLAQLNLSEHILFKVSPNQLESLVIYATYYTDDIRKMISFTKENEGLEFSDERRVGFV